jgi:hypothetical protein
VQRDPLVVALRRPPCLDYVQRPEIACNTLAGTDHGTRLLPDGPACSTGLVQEGARLCESRPRTARGLDGGLEGRHGMSVDVLDDKQDLIFH